MNNAHVNAAPKYRRQTRMGEEFQLRSAEPTSGTIQSYVCKRGERLDLETQTRSVRPQMVRRSRNGSVGVQCGRELWERGAQYNSRKE